MYKTIKTIFMNMENSNTNKIHKLKRTLADKINRKIPNEVLLY